MRTNGGAGRRLANGPSPDSWGGDAFRFPAYDVDADTFNDGPEERVRELEPVDKGRTTYAPDSLLRPPGIETRRPVHEVSYLIRPFGGWSSDQWTGQHGVIGARMLDRGQAAGGMQAWDGSRRTLRSAPIVPWDAGTALGPGSVTVGQ